MIKILNKDTIESILVDCHLLTILLDNYQMFDWGISWKDFLNQIQKEVNVKIEQWKQEEIFEEE